MSNAQHTPGRSPWTLTEGGLILDADRNLVATVATGPHGEEEANAPLLTAAPELLAALNALLECPDVNHDALDMFSVQAVEQARDAIAKARRDTLSTRSPAGPPRGP